MKRIKRVKKRNRRECANKTILLFFLLLFVISGLIGCGKQKLTTKDTAVSSTTAAEMPSEKTTDEKSGEEESSATTEEYLTPSDFADDPKDYSKYEESTDSVKQKQKSSTEKTVYSKNITKSDETKKNNKYHTDAVPKGKPDPVEPEDVTVDKKASSTCSLLVECKSVFSHLDDLKKEKENILPKDGIIYQNDAVVFYEGESVFDVLLREMKNNDIPMEYNFTPGYHSNYVEGIANLYEFDCGELSGWTYQVNSWTPNYGCSRYLVTEHDKIVWSYTCTLGQGEAPANSKN